MLGMIVLGWLALAFPVAWAVGQVLRRVSAAYDDPLAGCVDGRVVLAAMRGERAGMRGTGFGRN